MELAGSANICATSGLLRWKAVSKQATCGMSGSRCISSAIGARLCGWCSGASGSNSRSASRMCAFIRTGRA
jgi:hypothetical protein